MIVFDTDEEAIAVSNLAIGRLMSIFKGGKFDNPMEEYDKCKDIITAAAEHLGIKSEPERIGYCRSGWNFGNTTLD